jgi:hypothetical protein
MSSPIAVRSVSTTLGSGMIDSERGPPALGIGTSQRTMSSSSAASVATSG